MSDYDERRINGERCLSELAAQRYIGRGRTSLWTWRRDGLVKAYRVKLADGRWRTYYHRGSLRAASREMKRRKANQLHVAGPGRGLRATDEQRAKAYSDAERRKADKAEAVRRRRAEMRAAAEAAERAEDELYRRGNCDERL
ncbi:hypothetical protein ACIGKQ_03955 [Gordonia sp. NPDC062954]|uniref:hypothetical protein n=1 Tax=Gordonia sp. NPDC062954 TaxID=3364003 RepID=UPI0037CBF058